VAIVCNFILFWFWPKKISKKGICDKLLFSQNGKTLPQKIQFGVHLAILFPVT
jgi:hypothetical protein